MALNFTRASGGDSTVMEFRQSGTAPPFGDNDEYTFGCWFRRGTLKSTAQCIMAFGTPSNDDLYTLIQTKNSTGYLEVKADAGHLNSTNYLSSTNVCNNTWHYAALAEKYFGGFKYLECWLNGTLLGTSSGIVAATFSFLSTMYRISCGRMDMLTNTLSAAARIAHPFIAKVQATQAQHTALATGVCPLKVFGTDILGYWRLEGTSGDDPERESSGALDTYDAYDSGTPLYGIDMKLVGPPAITGIHAPVSPWPYHNVGTSPYLTRRIRANDGAVHHIGV